MDYLETEPLQTGWNRRTALLGDNRLAVPVRVFVVPVAIGRTTQQAMAYGLDRVHDWANADDFLAYLECVRERAVEEAKSMHERAAKDKPPV